MRATDACHIVSRRSDVSGTYCRTLSEALRDSRKPQVRQLHHRLSPKIVAAWRGTHKVKVTEERRETKGCLPGKSKVTWLHAARTSLNRSVRAVTGHPPRHALVRRGINVPVGMAWVGCSNHMMNLVCRPVSVSCSLPACVCVKSDSQRM